MRPSFRTRQILTAAAVGSAIRPPSNYWLGVPAMVSGGVAAEFAPHLLAATVGQAGYALVRGRRDPVGLALAGASAAGLGYLIQQARGTGSVMADALVRALGPDYLDELAPVPVPPPERAAWRQLLTPAFTSPRVRIERDLQYGAGDPLTTLDVVAPKERGPGPAPIIVQFHGGAWTTGDKRFEGGPFLVHMAERGWIGFNVNYRLAPRAVLPAAVIDVKRAIAWIRDHSDRYHADPSFLAVTGGSAGGHLAALAALTPNAAEFQPGFASADTSVQAAVPRYGIYDVMAESGAAKAVGRRDRFLAPTVIKKDFADHPEVFRSLSPLARATADAPPFLVIHGAHDTGVEVESARYFVDRFRAISEQVVGYAELPGAQHGFDYFPSIRSGHVARGVEHFLRWALARHRARSGRHTV